MIKIERYSVMNFENAIRGEKPEEEAKQAPDPASEQPSEAEEQA